MLCQRPYTDNLCPTFLLPCSLCLLFVADSSKITTHEPPRRKGESYAFIENVPSYICVSVWHCVCVCMAVTLKQAPIFVHIVILAVYYFVLCIWTWLTSFVSQGSQYNWLSISNLVCFTRLASIAVSQSLCFCFFSFLFCWYFHGCP